jgi:hypothetical protein
LANLAIFLAMIRTSSKSTISGYEDHRELATYPDHNRARWECNHSRSEGNEFFTNWGAIVSIR